ncbi:hypothetical protein [Clostridium ljungdahlii]|uniref:Transposase n=1 Tax=Clostridium ljungdahlii TaxID=1538 RepID=A0A168PIK3_9CLOT|nr:hypothetical protein [Clostridium ljungdahlii]OAA87788.1 hypothetical protein WY13_01903 [Clostridium ljungdahlii]
MESLETFNLNGIESKIEVAENFARMKMAVDIGIKMIDSKYDDKIIAEITGLSLADVKSMKP